MPILVNTWSATDKAAKLIAQAVSNEAGTITSNGTTKGDQNGSELCAVPWYQHSRRWGKVYRLTDSNLAESVAKTMTDAIVNGFIGYDTWNRDSLASALEYAGGKFNSINTPCDTDCSCLAYMVLRTVTGAKCEVDTAWLAEQMNAAGLNDTDYDEVYALLKTQPTPSPYTDPMCAARPLSATNNLQRFPKTPQWEYYMTRVLPIAGIGVECYTVDNYVDGVLRPGVAYDANNLDDRELTHYLYTTPFDSYSNYVASGDVSTLQANYTFSVSNDNEPYLTGATMLQRGDILRTRAPQPEIGSGHIAIWI